MVAIIPKNAGYVIQGVGLGTADLTQAKGYTVLGGSNAQAFLNESTSYLIQSTGHASASVIDHKSYALLTNPASISAANTYIVLATGDGSTASCMSAKGYSVLSSFYPPYEDLITEISFVDERFPDCVSFGSTGGPGFKTSIFEVDSGLVSTSPQWNRIRAKYNANFDHVPPADIESVENFFYGVKGRGIGFRYKDWSDYTISNQNFLVGDGTTTSFQLFKRYMSGGSIFDRIIKKPRQNTFSFTLNGVPLIENTDYFVGDGSGTVNFITAPPANSIGTIVQGEFDVPVRFDTDKLDVTYSDFRQLSISSLPMVEVII